MASPSKVTITINQPIEKVWNLFMDPNNLQHWLTGYISTTHLSGTPGEVGSTSLMKFLEGGREMEVKETVLQITPHQQYTFKMEHTSFENETEVRFISSGNQTEMIQTVQFVPKRFLMKVMMLLFKGAMKKRMESDLIRFKNFVETQA